MQPATSEGNPKYFILDETDIVQLGDEFYNNYSDNWIPCNDGEKDEDGFYPRAVIGYNWDIEDKPVRRKNPDFDAIATLDHSTFPLLP